MKRLQRHNVRPWLRSRWVRIPHCVITLPLIPVVAVYGYWPELWDDMRKNFMDNIRGLFPLEGE